MTPLCKVQNTNVPVSRYSVHIQKGRCNNPLTNFTWLSLVFPKFELEIERYIPYVIFTGLHITPENILEMGTWSTHQSSLQNFCINAWSLVWEYYLRNTYTTALLLDYEWLRRCKKKRRKSQTTANPHLLQRLHSWKIPQSMKL